jgi:acyl-CoA thioesterase I
MLTAILYVLLMGLIVFISAFFYVFKIIGSLPEDRAKQMLRQGRPQQGRVIACIGDSLTHGNIGVCWVAQLRQAFPNDHFLNEGVNGDVVWQVHQRLEPILECKPDIAVVLIGSNDAMGSIDPSAGERYKKSNKLPEAPTFEGYQKRLMSLLDRLQDVPHVALCTLPPVGEFPDSPMNQHIAHFNEFLKGAASQRNMTLLNVSHAMWNSLQQRTYPATHDYESKISVLGRRIIGACFKHYVFKTPWDSIAKTQGQWLLFDQIHLGERGAEIINHLVSNFLKPKNN